MMCVWVVCVMCVCVYVCMCVVCVHWALIESLTAEMTQLAMCVRGKTTDIATVSSQTRRVCVCM